MVVFTGYGFHAPDHCVILPFVRISIVRNTAEIALPSQIAMLADRRRYVRLINRFTSRPANGSFGMTAPGYAPLNPPSRILMGPGPSEIHPSVLAAMAAPTVGHLDPYFLQVMDEVQSMLRHVFQTKNHMTMSVSGTGSAGMETCVVNLIEPGDRMIVCVNGVFGGRMADVAARCGAVVTKLERPVTDEFPEQTCRVELRGVGAVHPPEPHAHRCNQFRAEQLVQVR